MSDPKRHHYIPRFYLQGFCRNEIFWIFDRERNIFRKQTPVNTAIETYFYSMQQPDGSYDSSLEKKMADIESFSAPIVKKADNGELLSSYDKFVLADFVSLFEVRVPEFENELVEFRSEMLKKLGPMVDRNPDSSIPRPPRPSFIPPEAKSIEALKLVQDLEALEAEPRKAHNEFVSMVFPMAAEISNYLQQMQWLIVQAPPETAFVTSDKPFLLVPPKGFDPEGLVGVGIATPGTTKIIPLSAKSCLLILDKGDGVFYEKFPRNRVRELNIIITRGCTRYVFARDEDHLRYLVKHTEIDKIGRTPKVKIM